MQSIIYLVAFYGAFAWGIIECKSPMDQYNGPWPLPVAKLGQEPVMDLGPSLLMSAAAILMEKLRANPEGRTGRQIYQEANDRAVAKIMRRLQLPKPHTRDGYESLDLASKILLNRTLIGEMCDTDKMELSMNEPWFTASRRYDTPTYDLYHAARVAWPDAEKVKAWASDL